MRRFTPIAIASMFVTIAISQAIADDLLPTTRGFRASIGPVETRLELPVRTAAALEAAGVPLETRGVGLQLDLGWSLSSYLSLDLRLAGSNNDKRETSLTPSVGSFMFEAKTRLRPGQRVDPWLVGGFGGVGIGFGEPADEKSTLEAGALSLGAGVDVRLSARWALSFAYRQATLQLERQSVHLPGVSDSPIEVVGDAELRQFGFGVDFRL